MTPFIIIKFLLLSLVTIFVLVQSLSWVQLFSNPWTAAREASLSITNSWNLLKLKSIQSVMSSNHLIICCPFLLLPPIFPSIRVFSNESGLHITWPEFGTITISPSNEYSGLISFRVDSQELSPTPQFKSINSLRTKVHLVKAMVFPVVMYGCESWTIKTAEDQGIDSFELWCWRKLLSLKFFHIQNNNNNNVFIKVLYRWNEMFIKVINMKH